MRVKYLIVIILLANIVQNSNAQNLDKKQIVEITNSIPNLISKNYVFKEKGKNTSIAFQKLVDSEKYLTYTNRDSLSEILSKDLRKISNDRHLYVKVKKANKDNSIDKDWEKQEKENEVKNNYGFSSVQILDNNIGYIRITEFTHPRRSMPTAVAAMKMVENTEGLIIDLRGNGGGYPGIMLYILNHFFDGPPIHLSTTYFSDKNEVPYTLYTSDLIYGKLRVNTPLFVLIDSKTASAAEYFAYTAQAFDVGVIVGENSSGGAHMNDFFDLPHNFRLSVSIAAPIITKTNSNWEMTGVEPNYKVESNISIEKAIELVNNKK